MSALHTIEESIMNLDFTPDNSGLFIPRNTALERERVKKRLMAVDLFAGCGGSSLGVQMAGMNVVAMVEWDTDAVITYCTNLCRWGDMKFHFLGEEDETRMEKKLIRLFKKDKKDEDQLKFSFAGEGWIQHHPEIEGTKHVIVGDIRKLKGEDLMRWIGVERGELGCIFGSPPCQGFSSANSNKCSADIRNDLCFEFARLVVECLPQIIWLENVPEFQTSPQLPRFIQILKDGGFEGVEALENLVKKKGGVVGRKHRYKTISKKAEAA